MRERGNPAFVSTTILLREMKRERLCTKLSEREFAQLYLKEGRELYSECQASACRKASGRQLCGIVVDSKNVESNHSHRRAYERYIVECLMKCGRVHINGYKMQTWSKSDYD